MTDGTDSPLDGIRDATDNIDDKQRRALITAASATAGFGISVAGVWLWWRLFGTLVTAGSVIGFVAGLVFIPLLAIVFGGTLGRKGLSNLLDWLGAACTGAWGLYLNSRERQEFVAVDREAGVAHTSDGDLHFDVDESTEYQVGKRPFYLLFHRAEEAARTFRHGVDNIESGYNPAEEGTVDGAADGGLRAFSRRVYDGRIGLATRYDGSETAHLVEMTKALAPFVDEPSDTIGRDAKQKVQKEEGGTGAATLSYWVLLSALALGAGTGLLAGVIV